MGQQSTIICSRVRRNRPAIEFFSSLLGLARYVALSGENGTGGLPYADALRNFYEAARYGLHAKIVWPGTGAMTADVLLLEQFIPKARKGLSDLGVDESEGGFLDIVEARVRSRQTGACWQRKVFEAYGGGRLQVDGHLLRTPKKWRTCTRMGSLRK